MAIALYLIAIYTALHFYLLNSFIELEKVEAKNSAARVVGAMNTQLAALSRFNTDWASWDDSYEFIINKNKQFIDCNISNNTFNKELASSAQSKYKNFM